jgi:trans-2,3-dihydro-3-hydroxyanthranilate isomerase
MEYRFIVADVFTDTAYGGNPLAVVLDGSGLDTRQMQAIAREMNLSETSFVMPGRAAGRFEVRMFSPATELPFAGHPTVGTAAVLAATGVAKGLDEIILDEPVGPVRVALGPESATFTLDGPPERRPAPAGPAEIASAIGVDLSDIVGTPWQAGYAGVAYLCVELRDRAAVSRAFLTKENFERLKLWGPGAYVFSSTDRRPGYETIFVRSFVPGVGVPEDPATGAAAAAFAGTRLDAAWDGRCRLTLTQGVDMGRPSRIETEVKLADGKVAAVSVGGNVVLVSEGRLLHIP